MALFTLIGVNAITNIFYKGRSFKDASWSETIFLSFFFFIGWVALLLLSIPKATFLSSSINYFFIASVLWLGWPIFIRQVGVYPAEYLKKNSHRFLTRFNFKISIIKYNEILLQQFSFLYLFFVVLENMPLSMRLMWGTIIIGGFHLINYFFMPKKWATIYFLLSIPMSSLFGFLILKGAIALTLSIHLAFYILQNSYYWFSKEDKNHLQ